MRGNKKKVLVLLGILLSTASLIHLWNSNTTTVVNILHGPDPLKKLLEEKIQNLDNELEAIPYNLKNGSLMHLAMNGCVCVGDGARIHFPFSNLLLPQISATQLQGILKDSNPQRTQQVRTTEFKRFRERTYTAADSLIYAKPNSPLQYPTQGVEVRPTRTILIPGLSVYKASKEDTYLVNLTASKGTFNTAAVVDGVDVRGEGEMYISFASRSLAMLNRQLQFVTYTNTHFHPNTADVVQFKAGTFQAEFTIKIRHPPIPKFFTPGPKQDYTISNLVTIATKTFLRYDKLQDLINSVRQFYPNITIIIADDTKDPKLVTGPYIEHYIMPFGKGWFAGRNLAVSQVTTKYVLWVDDDFIFTSNTKLEKMVDILEKTTLDLVGGAVREVTGYTATYRHMLSTDGGDEEGDCLHIRTGYHHVIDGFPNCVVTDAVINFFMARTEKVRQVGFDPRLARVGHLAFFTDGLGSLHVGSCDDVIVNHASKIQMMMPWGRSKTDKAYSKFRYQSDEKHSFNEYDLYYLKNHFKCVTSD